MSEAADDDVAVLEIAQRSAALAKNGNGRDSGTRLSGRIKPRPSSPLMTLLLLPAQPPRPPTKVLSSAALRVHFPPAAFLPLLPCHHAVSLLPRPHSGQRARRPSLPVSVTLNCRKFAMDPAASAPSAQIPPEGRERRSRRDARAVAPDYYYYYY